MGKRKGRGYYKNSLRVSDLENEYEAMKGVHTEFEKRKKHASNPLDPDIINIELHLHRVAQGAYDACEFGKLKGRDPRLTGQFQTAFIASRTYIQRIGTALGLLQLVS